jgi:probable HAF family extracellular repeat protein
LTFSASETIREEPVSMPVYTYTTIDDPSATKGTTANDINNEGQIVGSYNNASGQHGFLYSNGVFTTLDEPLATNGTEALGINDMGQIVGDYDDGRVTWQATSNDENS